VLSVLREGGQVLFHSPEWTPRLFRMAIIGLKAATTPAMRPKNAGDLFR
jgi:hypothetical protein